MPESVTFRVTDDPDYRQITDDDPHAVVRTVTELDADGQALSAVEETLAVTGSWALAEFICGVKEEEVRPTQTKVILDAESVQQMAAYRNIDIDRPTAIAYLKKHAGMLTSAMENYGLFMLRLTMDRDRPDAQAAGDP